MRLAFHYIVERTVKPLPGTRKLTRKRLRHLRTHFVAAPPDCRSQSRLHVTRFGAKFNLHPPQRLRRNPPQRAAPARMHRCHRPMSFVDQQNRHAVRCLHAQQKTRLPGHQRIAAQWPRLRRCNQLRYVGMDLLERHEREMRAPQIDVMG